MKLNEFVKMHKNFTKGMKTLNEESMENFDVEKFTQDLDDADAISSGGEMTFTPEETTTRCFSQMGHKVSFNDAVTLLFDYLGQKNLANFATIANRDEDGKCDQDLVAAIQIAQEDLGVNVDGIMGRKTIGALRDATLDPGFLNNDDKEMKLSKSSDVLIVGDSIATGMIVAYAKKGLGYPECKDKFYGTCKLPMALGGTHTFQILSMVRKNLSKDKQSKGPRLMIVSAGTNDALAYSATSDKFTPEDTLSKIDQISQIATAAGYKVKFKTIDPIGKSKIYKQEKYNEFAEKVNNTLTSKYETFSGSDIPLQDFVHPTNQGFADLINRATSGASSPSQKPVQSVKKREIEDSSRPSGNSKYVTYIEQNLQIVENACQDVLGVEFSFTTDGIKNFQKAAGFSGETTTFKVTVKKKPTTRTIEGQIDGKIGPHTMTALTLLYFINQETTPEYDTPMAEHARLNPVRMFESCNLSLKDRLENNLQFINEEEDGISFEKFANTKYFKSRVANTHSIMKLQNPSIPPFNQINFPFDNKSLIEEKYEIHENIGIAKKYGNKKIELIKIMIDQIKASMPSDAHSPGAIIAILGVCAKESAFGPTKEGTGYGFSNIKRGKTGDAVAGRVNKRFLDHLNRYPTDDEIRAITGGGRNGIALFNMAYGYSRALQVSGYDGSDRRIPASVKVVVKDSSTGKTKINPALYNPELAGFKYRGHGAVQMTGYGNYRYLEKIASDQGGKVARMFKGVKDDPEIVIKTPEHNVISSIMYMNFPHAKYAMKRAIKKGDETEMEFLVRKYASGPFGSTIGQKRYSRKYKRWYEPSMSSRINGQINLSAASNKTAGFIIVE